MPFGEKKNGLQGAPGTYSDFMYIVFGDVVGPNLQFYLDNLDIANGGPGDDVKTKATREAY